MTQIPHIESYTSYKQLFLFCLLLIQYMNYVSGRSSSRSRTQCDDPEPLQNGYSVSKRRNLVLEHNCNMGFTLIGQRRTQCIRGKWSGDRPVCAKPGCTLPTVNPEHGRIQPITSLRTGMYCSEGYDLAGNRYAYCNGTDWDRSLGSCRVHSGKVSHECDFETADICGWVADVSEGFKWRRVMAANLLSSFRTGPRHDHTTMKESGGHYMLMESFGLTTTPTALSSPIYKREISLKTACCFQFYYFMYGAGVGNLNVYVKPVSKMLTDVTEKRESFVKFTKSGNQNSIWNEGHFNIEEMEDDFQIVFVADGAKNHLSDIAIDDVKILTGTECKFLEGHSEEPDDSAEYDTTTAENFLIYDTRSCVNRCMKESSTGIMRQSDNTFLELCSCDEKCMEVDECCPDYIKVCLDSPNDEALSTTNTPATTATLPNTTTITTTRQPSVRSAQNSTTTLKPTTKTITTTRTVKPTAPPSTSTTATTQSTRIPTTVTSTTTATTRTTTTTITTTRKPTTTTTRRITPTTTYNPTTKRALPTTKSSKATTTMKTTTTTKRSTTSTTTLTPTKLKINTQLMFDRTTASAIERKAASTETEVLPHKPKNQSQKNATKSTWEWQPKPESNPRESLALACVFGLLLTIIIVGAVYRQRTALKQIWSTKILKKGQNGDGAEDSNSIIANFSQEDPTRNGCSAPSGSTGGNRLKLTLPSLKRGKQEKRKSADEDELFDNNDNDDIPLL